MTYLNGQEILDKPRMTNENDATLSGTPIIIIIKDENGTDHYIKAYPTKV